MSSTSARVLFDQEATIAGNVVLRQVVRETQRLIAIWVGAFESEASLIGRFAPGGQKGHNFNRPSIRCWAVHGRTRHVLDQP